MPADLAHDTASKPGDRPGRYHLDLHDGWNYVTPSGGVLMSAALRAMGTELEEPGMSILSATTVFCTPVPHGPLTIDVQTLRKGRAVAQLRAAVQSDLQPDDAGLEVSATFGRDRDGPAFTDAEMPDVPPPEDCEPYFFGPNAPPSPLPLFGQVDMRLAKGHRWWREEFEPGAARFARWFRYYEPQRTPEGLIDNLCLPPIIDIMPPALFEKIGKTARDYYVPSLDLTVHFLGSTTSEWLLVSGYSRKTRAGYATGEVEVWDTDGQLVAFGTQMMILRRMKKIVPTVTP